MQGDTWTFPYFSVAENVLSKGQWAISKSDWYLFNSLIEAEKPWFKFSASESTEDLVPFSNVHEAFVHAIILAKLLLPFVSPILALVAFQIGIHCIVCIAIVRRFSENYLKLGFVAFYALNPVLLKFVCFPFYYFWQMIPSFFLVLYLLDRKSWGYYLLPVALILGFSIGLRGTTVLVVGAFLLLALWREKSVISLISLVLVICIKVFLYNGDASPWHTMYVGVGGYGNPHGLTLTDTVGYNLYEEETGIALSTNVINGNCYEADTRSACHDILKKGYLNVLEQSPFMLISNATKNTLAGYSFGYFVGVPWLQWIASISGAGIGIILLLLRQYLWFLAIGLSLITHTSFYPPIPAYMYGSYLILIVAFLKVMNPLHGKIKNLLALIRTDKQTM